MSETTSADVPKPAPAATSETAIAAPEPTVAPPNVASIAPAQVTAVPISDAAASTVKTGQAATPVKTASTENAEPDITAAIAKELQNPLTKKFTEAEWKALFEFRAQLPDIFAQAYPENSKARDLPVTIWGIAIHPATPQDDARVSVVLLKFLRARNLSVTEARDMLVNTLRWRESFNIEAALKEDFPEEVFGKLGYIYGKDKGGRPVAYNIYGGNSDLKAVFGDVQRFIRWRVAFMEKSVALLDFVEIDQMIQIHDYLGVSFTSRDANSKAAASEATNIFQSHYPELLYKKWFINIPAIFNWIFWLFKPLISANTLAKMSVVGTGHYAIKKALLPFIDSKELPERLPYVADSTKPRNSSKMTKRTKKVGITGKYGVRYGASLRKQVKKMEISQHARYTCTFCGKDSVKRTAVGIWHCSACKKTIAGGAWSVSTTAAATVRSTVRRLRELTEA
ncbi:hypothetical protein CVT25_010142 [Psilocybe cyanescens]|uniref:Phosphatidylinositol transfer protein SFH5 n=1 Tax=Psilocybe cyanescens TaxID=93625 RepID=A0A409XJ01_PSICY|nr:hypothetical protein CVT25_010142 [Psilocybe cyanescens]